LMLLDSSKTLELLAQQRPSFVTSCFTTVIPEVLASLRLRNVSLLNCSANLLSNLAYFYRIPHFQVHERHAAELKL